MNLSEKLSIASGNRQVSIHESFYPISRKTFYTVFILPPLEGEKIVPLEFDSLEELEKWVREYLVNNKAA